MSKALTDALKAHLALPATTMTTCWRITREDGATFAFTALDVDLTIDGVVYRSIAGFTRSAIVTDSTLAVDNLEVLGYFDSGAITAEGLRNGLFDYATIHVFGVNWADLTQDRIKLRRGTFGECVRSEAGSFRTELRGMTQALVQEFGEVLSPLCRAQLGDARCKIPILPARWSAGMTATTGGIGQVSAGTYIAPLVQNTDALRVAIFQCTMAGTAGGSEPAWDTTVTHTTTDGGITWLAITPYRLIGAVGSVISAREFTTVDPLFFPGSAAAVNASILFVDTNHGHGSDISAGTAVELTDGVGTVSWDYPFTVSGASAAATALTAIQAAIAANTIQMTVTALPNSDLGLANLRVGGVGKITKTGDTHGRVVISNFADDYVAGATLTWKTGANAGRSIEIKNYAQANDDVTLWLSAFYPIQPGDTFFYYPGCDFRRDTCFGKFNNMLNFRGEPDVPGLDMLTNYPQAS